MKYFFRKSTLLLGIIITSAFLNGCNTAALLENSNNMNSWRQVNVQSYKFNVNIELAVGFKQTIEFEKTGAVDPFIYYLFNFPFLSSSVQKPVNLLRPFMFPIDSMFDLIEEAILNSEIEGEVVYNAKYFYPEKFTATGDIVEFFGIQSNLDNDGEDLYPITVTITDFEIL